MDVAYLGANDNDKIQERIQKIKSGLTWNYENLKLLQDERETIVVQNELFWFDETNVTPTVMSGCCFNLIMVDYNRLPLLIPKGLYVYSEKGGVLGATTR